MKEYTYPDEELPTPGNSRLLALVGENKKVLEVGCAMGYQSRSLSEVQGCQVTGIEVDAKAADHARPYCEDLIVGDIEVLDLDRVINSRRFDVITFADVLEHLRDPVAALRKVRPFLATGGYVVASVPNITHCAVIYEMARGRFEYRAFGLLDDSHIRFFAQQSVYRTFEQAGYLIVAISRNSVPASSTEFRIRAETDEDRQFLDYIKQRNPDADTYQFVVKAVPIDDAQACQSELIAAQEKVRLLLNDAKLHDTKIRQLESNLEWITRRPLYRLLSTFRWKIRR
jgi:2-polyprenyl-3-methyl-5-hydroxy-6-metoxy-1,4-benzoquinol methylase